MSRRISLDSFLTVFLLASSYSRVLMIHLLRITLLLGSYKVCEYTLYILLKYLRTYHRYILDFNYFGLKF